MSAAEPYLLVESARGAYLLPARRVHEIAWLPLLSAPPTDRPAQVGTADIRGRSTPVLDLDAALGRSPAPYTLDHRLVALLAGDGLVGLVVPTVRDIVDVQEAHIDPDDRDPSSPVVGTARLEDGVAGVLDPEPLANLPPDPERSVALEDLLEGFDDDQLEELEARKRELTTEADAASHEARSAALVELGEETLAVPLDSVREFVEAGDLTPVPSTPPHVLGLLNHRGELVPVVDLSDHLGVQGSLGEAVGSVVVLDLDDGPTGVAVDGIAGTVGLPEEAFDPSRSSSQHAQGSFVHGDRTVSVVDLEDVLESDRVTIEQEV